MSAPSLATLITISLTLVAPSVTCLNYQAELALHRENVTLWPTNVEYFIPAGQCSALVSLQTNDVCGDGKKPLGFSVVLEDVNTTLALQVDDEWKAVTIRRQHVHKACAKVAAWVSLHKACDGEMIEFSRRSDRTKIVELAPVLQLSLEDEDSDDDS